MAYLYLLSLCGRFMTIDVGARWFVSWTHYVDVITVESASLSKLLQSLAGNQVVLAVSHDDMQTQ